MTDLQEAWREQLARAENVPASFDYVVCGAGVAGCVVAARLAQDGDRRVLLLEAGGRDDVDVVSDPNRWPQTLGTDLDWNFGVEPNPNLDGRVIPFNMGRVLGGGSSVNVGTWSRGHRADWDGYAAATGEAAWSYPAVLDLYRDRIEAWAGEPDPLRGRDGRVHVQPAADQSPFAAAVLEAAASSGLPRFANANGAMMEAAAGCAPVDEIVRDGRRPSIFASYVAPLLTLPNLTVLTGATVTALELRAGRAVGVRYRRAGREQSAFADVEIVLSLGAIGTPRLLMLSGIGAAADLAAVGITPEIDLPGVGAGLHDHVAFGCVWEAGERFAPPIPRSQVAMFWGGSDADAAPDCYAYARRGPAITPENRSALAVPDQTWSLMVGMRPRSRGSVRLRGADPAEPPVIDTGYLADARDIDDLLAAMDVARRIGRDAALTPFTGRQVAPDASDPAQLREYLRRGLVTFWHQSGTARMGTDERAVTDGRLRVRGVEGLRIADASILPRVTTGNTMAPCVVVGERAAGFLGV